MLPANIEYNNLTAVVQRGMDAPIRRMEPDLARQAIARAISGVCSTMGLEPPAPDALAIAVDTVHKRFASIGAHEILTAFQLYADGTLEVDSKFYYAKFSLKTLGEILMAYIEYRRDTAAAIIRAKDEAERIQHEAEAKAAKQAAYDAGFPALIQTFIGTWQDIPPHWYDTALRLGMMPEPDNETKRAIYQDALDKAHAEVSAEAGEHANIFAYRHALRLIEDGETVQARAISISKKLVVWEHFFKSKNQVQ